MNPTRILLLFFVAALSGCTAQLPGGLDAGAPDAPEAGHEHAMDAGHADGPEHDGMHDQNGMERPGFAPEDGNVPSAAEAEKLEQVSSLRIIGDDGFRPAAGVRGGNGTLDDPYVISGYYVAGDLYIQDTDACFVVRDNYIGGQLSLNWNGICTYVHHNYIYDLRVNENIRRDGYATGGIIEDNDIGFVGQLRHYDGEFRYNEVGPMPPGGPFDAVLETTPLLAQDLLIANIDGFNQGLIHHNTFHGSVDLDLHGHHHGTGFFAPHSHYHGDNESRKMPHDHTQRWTSVAFTDNVIIDPDGYGLRYEDHNHAGDDRVATSEQEKTLDEDHFHRTHVELLRNRVEGAGIWIDVFNADDSHHPERNDGWIEVLDNTVLLKERDDGPLGLFGMSDWHTAIKVAVAKEMELRIEGNHLEFEAAPPQGPLSFLSPRYDAVAIDLQQIHDARITVLDNTGAGFDTGVLARDFEAVAWAMEGNDIDAERPLDADDSVPLPE